MTVANLQAAIKGVNIALSNEVCNQLFLRHDVDNSGFISVDEFRAIFDEVNEWFVSFGGERLWLYRMCSNVLIPINLEKWSMKSFIPPWARWSNEMFDVIIMV